MLVIRKTKKVFNAIKNIMNNIRVKCMEYIIKEIKKVFNAINGIYINNRYSNIKNIKNNTMNKNMDHEFGVANEIKRNKEELDKKIKELKEMEEKDNVYDMDYNILKDDIRTTRERLNEWEKEWQKLDEETWCHYSGMPNPMAYEIK